MIPFTRSVSLAPFPFRRATHSSVKGRSGVNFTTSPPKQAKESFDAATSVAAAKLDELKEATKAHKNAKSLVVEIREVEAKIARQLRVCAEVSTQYI